MKILKKFKFILKQILKIIDYFLFYNSDINSYKKKNDFELRRYY